MDLMKLAAQITLDDREFVQGIRDAESAGKRLSGKMSAMTVAVGNLAADMIKKGVSAINGVIGGAVDSYADYEQLIGGVETLFKSSASKVANYAKQSFRTTGLSANDYMETVTSFAASLIQGLEGDTDKAADVANIAITDMADNANKMGTSIESIQNAYQGFAKQNYTMLDNLKLGYGGTREEMIRLVNDSGILDKKIKSLDDITFDQLVLAIHAIQEQLGITGTTAEEAAQTISGSKASLKAAWEDLLSAVGGEGDQKRLDETMENFKTSFSTYMTNFLPSLMTTITNSGSLVDAIADAITTLPTNLVAQLGEEGLGAGTKMIGAISKITTWLIDSITNTFKSASADPTQIQEFGKAIGDFIGTAIGDIVTNAPAIMQGIIDAGVALAGGLAEGLFKGLFGEGAEVDKIAEQLQKDITDVNVQNAQASALVRYIDGLVDKYGEGVTEATEFKMAVAELDEVLPGAGEVFEKYGENVQLAIDKLNDMIAAMRRTSIQAGLTKALNEQYELLGEQMSRKAQAEYAADIYGSELQGLRDSIVGSIKAYAGEYIRENATNPMADPATWAAAQSVLRNNSVMIGNDQVSINTATAEQLSSLISYFGNNLQFSENPIWDRSLTDSIFSPKELEGFLANIRELNNGITDANQSAADAQKEIDATNKQIAITEQAVQNAMAESFGSAAGEVESGGNAVGSALSGVAGKLSSWSPPSGGGYSPVPQKAVGMDWVPYDGYRAELHRGEAILTKSENESRRRGGNSEAFAEAMEDALVSAMEKVNILMSGEKVADLTTKRVNKNISASGFSRTRGMGG